MTEPKFDLTEPAKLALEYLRASDDPSKKIQVLGWFNVESVTGITDLRLIIKELKAAGFYFSEKKVTRNKQTKIGYVLVTYS